MRFINVLIIIIIVIIIISADSALSNCQRNFSYALLHLTFLRQKIWDVFSDPPSIYKQNRLSPRERLERL